MGTDNPTEYTPRGYQTEILDRVVQARGDNLLLELDCGMGKRFILHQLVVERLPELRFMVVANSTSSCQETADYLRDVYGGLDDEVGELSSRTPYRLRKWIIKDKRVVVTTAGVLSNMIKKDPKIFSKFDVLLINEVDTIVRRTGGRRVVVQPWPNILQTSRDTWIIGMSGTLRDSHVEVTRSSFKVKRDIDTLVETLCIKDTIFMDSLEAEDLDEHTAKTALAIVPVRDRDILEISLKLDDLIRNTREDIMLEGGQKAVRAMGRANGRLHLVLDQLDVSDALSGRYQALLMIRKMMYAMPPYRTRHFLKNNYLQRFFPSDLMSRLSRKSTKVREVVRFSKLHDKTVVLSSYLNMVDDIEEMLEGDGVTVFKLTGKVQDKGAVLKAFRNHSGGRSALVLSPVGERDLDVPQAGIMIICDVINTEKTMYQRMKRIRGGNVVFLVYRDTTGERKVNRLIDQMVQKYPWSTKIER